MHFQTVFAISTIATAALATPVKFVEKRQSPVQACGNNLNTMCCDSFEQQLLAEWFPIQVGQNCNGINSASDCQQNVACCQTGEQNGLINIGNICPQINL